MARAFYRGYYDGTSRAGQVRRCHIMREDGPFPGRQGLCGTTGWDVTNSPVIILDPMPERAPDGVDVVPEVHRPPCRAAGRVGCVRRRTRGGGPMSLHLVPITRDEAFAFIAAIHRHHQPPQGYRYAVGVRNDNHLVGVATAGRPVARHLDDKATVEVTRVAVIEGIPYACSMLYGACWRAAQALGYTRAVTYTQAGESGASLRAAGWERVAELGARPGWDMPSRRRAATGTENVDRIRWQKTSRSGHVPRPELVLPPAVEVVLRGDGQLDLFAEAGAA